MSTACLIRRLDGSLYPADDESAEALRRVKAGNVIDAEWHSPVNARFRRKWWALARFAFDVWAETMPAQEFHGHPVLPDFQRFRKDLTIAAGFFRPVWNIKGELRVEAESLKWSSMDEERFEALYSATIDAILRKIIPHAGYDEERLRAAVDTALGFA